MDKSVFKRYAWLLALGLIALGLGIGYHAFYSGRSVIAGAVVLTFGGLLLGRAIAVTLIPNRKCKDRVCRSCGARETTLALEYGEDEGLCRECLDKYLPLALRG